jgi:hypothetical protein
VIAFDWRERFHGKLGWSFAIPPVSVSQIVPEVSLSTALVPVEWKRLVSE